ncbi:MAG: heavy metal translocating P-type ATPase [Rhodobacteraceae bacterium]|nr:heavy metal translocating P-type ATPase [Paracoccaceae bacterium]
MTNETGETCYHCHLAIPPETNITAEVLKQTRVFCSPGCVAVAKSIVGSGLDDFYRYRGKPEDDSGEKGADADTPHTVYDHPEVQKSFVRDSGDNREASLILEGIRCSACLWLNEQHLRKIDGIKDVQIDANSHQARVTWAPDQLKLSAILAAVADIGFSAHPFDPTRREQLVLEQKHRSIERLLFAGFLMMPVMSFQIASYWIGGPDETGTYPLFESLGRWFMLAVVTIVMAYSGQDFFRGAWRDLKNKQPGMDVPVVLGLTTAWVGSAVATFVGHGDVYFDSIVMFVFFVLLARTWELHGRMKSANALDATLKILPRTAQRVLLSGGVEQVSVLDLNIGDTLRLLPGENVPVDGRLLSEVSAFDESLLTGEAIPVLRNRGDIVIGGACNVDQPVEIEVTRTSDSSTMMEIHQMIARGLNDRPKYAQIADRIAPWFIAAVLGIALLTIGFWLWVDPSRTLPSLIAVLIVTCPCALALATPVALSISAGRFANLNVLPMRMAALEPLSKATMVVFDKTGTLTLGRPVLAAQFQPGEMEAAPALAIAAELEAKSEHPFAHALKSAATQQHLEYPASTVTRNYPGQGVEAAIDGTKWRLGGEAFSLADLKPLSKDAKAWRDKQISLGHSVVTLADANNAKSLFAFADELRDHARESIEELQQSGFKDIVILSGDNQAAVDKLAKLVRVKTAIGGLKPNDKFAWVQKQQRGGERVVMVGDGINDAPVMTAADAAISFSGATELARQSSDFVILGTDFTSLTAVFKLSAATGRVIKQNLIWAAGYNLLAVPAAALGYVPPWAAAIGMSVSSLLVVSNAMRLRTK